MYVKSYRYLFVLLHFAFDMRARFCVNVSACACACARALDVCVCVCERVCAAYLSVRKHFLPYIDYIKCIFSNLQCIILVMIKPLLIISIFFLFQFLFVPFGYSFEFYASLFQFSLLIHLISWTCSLSSHYSLQSFSLWSSNYYVWFCLSVKSNRIVALNFCIHLITHIL